MLIVYKGRDEVLVCIPATEGRLKVEYFEEGGRDINDYDREELSHTARISFYPVVES